MSNRDIRKIMIGIRSNIMMRWPAFSFVVVPVIILAFLMLFSIFGYAYTKANLNVITNSAIDDQFKEDRMRLQADFDSYFSILRGSSGYMQTKAADKDGWEKFISVYDLSRNFVGLEAVGIASGSSIQTVNVAYTIPHTPQTEKTIGNNLATSSPLIFMAMQRSVRSGIAEISGTLPDLFSTKKDAQPKNNGFIMLKPFYDDSLPHDTPEQRVNALRGYSIAMFRGDILFNTLYRGVDMTHKKLHIYLGDVKPANLQFQTDHTTDVDQTIASRQLKVHGATFTLVYSYDTEYILPFAIKHLPGFLLFSGIGLGVLIGAIAGYLLRSRYRRLIYEKERDINFAKDELLSLASHQLRTPATGVKQYLGMVLQGFAGDLNKRQREYLDKAYSSNNRQLHIINDILHLAKLESGRIVLAERKFDIAEMIREIVEEQRDQAKDGEISLEVHTPSTGMIIGDSHMLRMVVENLLSNAIKYTQKQGKVSVRLRSYGLHWTIIIKDSGVGIARSDLGKLFRQFSRISNVRSDFVTGTGIGLYLAYHLVILHGGTISVSSEEGKGSTFTVRLPRKM